MGFPSLCRAVLLFTFLVCSKFAPHELCRLTEDGGIINGIPLKSTQHFPHHVGIQVFQSWWDEYYCGGSIIAKDWVLTSHNCVWGQVERLIVYFNRLNIGAAATSEPNSYDMQIDWPTIVNHPVELTLSLLRLPVSLRFDSHVAPIALASDPLEDFTNEFAVIAGLQPNSTGLSYGELQILPKTSWSGVAILTTGWLNVPTVPCGNVRGGGLVVDWPGNPRLVGVFYGTAVCDSKWPVVHWNVSHHIDWIMETIRTD